MKVLTITVNPALDLTAVVHSFHAGGVNRIHSHQEDAGGKGVNVASFLADFKVPVVASGFLGEENDQAFINLFAEKAIDNAFIAVKGRTRSNIKLIDESLGSQGITDINFPGFQVSSEDWQAFEQKLPSLASQVSYAVISGSLPEGLGPDHYKRLIAALKALGVKVAVDTSGKALEAALLSQPHCIKPNEYELSEALGRDILSEADALRAARELNAKGIETVIVSMGAKGALFCRKDEAIFASPPETVVKSTVGAGDAMLAGYILGSLRELNLEGIAKLATAFSVAAITVLGPRLPSSDLVEASVSKVHCRRVTADSVNVRN
jgi:1-phosphofructokinase